MKPIENIINILVESCEKYKPPLIDQIIQEYGNNPFLILIACLLSLRTQDKTTIHVCRTLFKQIKTPADIIKLESHELEKIIYKTGCYKTKARTLKHVSFILITHHHGHVPKTYQELIAIKGVGPKTANLVLGYAFKVPAICVDTHVHRISNRLGIITTKTVEQTEIALKKAMPKKYWILWNKLLVTWGQNVCTPRNPKCFKCPIKDICKYAKTNSGS